MSRSGSDLAEVKLLLQAQILALCKHLAPQGHRSGNYWMAKNPTRNDRNPGSFWIVLTGAAAGAWRDEATNDEGDVLGLIAYIHGKDVKDVKPALAFARGWLGLADMPEGLKRERLVQARAREKTEAERDAQRLIDERKAAHATWLKCQKSLLGTPAEVYLAGRRIDLSALERQPGALRFSPAQWHREADRQFPAIVAAMTGADGAFIAIHRTFLAPDGAGKAPATPTRKIWPRFGGTGACVHLWRGETGLSARKAHEQGLWDRLVITEGLEDGLSVVVACPEYRVWVAGTLGNIGSIQLPACSGEVIVCADNDWGKPEAQAVLDKALMALVRQGRREVKLARSPIGKDVNDALMADL